MPYKYVNYHPTCPDQPCLAIGKFTQRNFSAFRFTHNPPIERDFLPPAIIDGPKASDACGRFALSFFDTVLAAQTKFHKLNKKFNAVEKYGGYISQFDITGTDGEASQACTRTGHIDLHEYTACDFSNRHFGTTQIAPQVGGADATP